MTPKQVAKMSGCTPAGVRAAIRKGRLDADVVDCPGGFEYQIQPLEARRFRDNPRDRGRPRGSKNKD